MKVGKECRKSVVHAHTTESARTIFKSTHYIYDSAEDKPQKPKKMMYAVNDLNLQESQQRHQSAEEP